jgi:hypothetical protein
MSHENEQSAQQFANSYPVPADQAAFESSLIDSYESQFPESAALMHDALDELKRFSGADIPKYRVAKKQEDLAKDQGDVDEQGQFGSPDTRYALSSLSLKMYKDPAEQDISNMSEYEKAEANRTSNGMSIIGELPPETTALLNGIYSLIGAETVRDDRAQGEEHGVVLRRGVYNGSPVYIKERYTDNSFWQGKSTLSVVIENEHRGKITETGLSETQLHDFMDMSGIGLGEVHTIISEDGITSANYKDYASAYGQTRAIIKEAEASWGTEAPDYVDGTFIEEEAEEEEDDASVKQEVAKPKPYRKVVLDSSKKYFRRTRRQD